MFKNKIKNFPNKNKLLKLKQYNKLKQPNKLKQSNKPKQLNKVNQQYPNQNNNYKIKKIKR